MGDELACGNPARSAWETSSPAATLLACLATTATVDKTLAVCLAASTTVVKTLLVCLAASATVVESAALFNQDASAIYGSKDVWLDAVARAVLYIAGIGVYGVMKHA